VGIKNNLKLSESGQFIVSFSFIHKGIRVSSNFGFEKRNHLNFLKKENLNEEIPVPRKRLSEKTRF